MIVNGVPVPYLPDQGRSGRSAPTWQAVALTAINAAVVVTCLLTGMEIAAVITAVVLIIMAGGQGLRLLAP
jgi:hypothetical protein